MYLTRGRLESMKQQSYGTKVTVTRVNHSVWLTPEQHLQVRQLAAERHLSTHEYIEFLLLRELRTLDRHKKMRGVALKNLEKAHAAMEAKRAAREAEEAASATATVAAAAAENANGESSAS
jgi:hypothetical protein